MSARNARPRPAPEAPPIAPPAPDPPAAVLRSPKILDRHLERLAVVYVRQSSPHQVLYHRESRARQYALPEHAVALGWPRSGCWSSTRTRGRAASRQNTGAASTGSWPRSPWSTSAWSSVWR